MSLYEIVAVVISVISIIMSIISLIKAWKADKIAQGQIEISIHQLINQTKKDVMDISVIVSEKLSANKEEIEALKQALKTAQEQNLNAYEEACAKYLDGKVDKERFKKKKNYSVEIRQLVEKYSEKYGATTPYKATIKVYNKWNNLEK